MKCLVTTVDPDKDAVVSNREGIDQKRETTDTGGEDGTGVVLDAYADFTYAFKENYYRGRGYHFASEEEAKSTSKYSPVRQAADRALFVFKLATTNLQHAEFPTDGNDVQWTVENDLSNFFPDMTEFLLTAAECVVCKEKDKDIKPSFLCPSEALLNVEVDSMDFGNRMWILVVPKVGFPIDRRSDDGSFSTCIMREHHRQVMYLSLAWLLQYSTTICRSKPTNDNSRLSTVVAAICGSPGIGKSRCLIFLMWFLLQRKCPF